MSEVVLRQGPVGERGSRTFLALALALVLGASILAHVQRASDSTGAAPAAAAQRASATKTLSSLPLSFIANAGQTDPRVSFMLQGSDTSLYFTRGGVTWSLSNGNKAWVVKQTFIGASPTKPVGIGEQKTVFSWFKGSPHQWVRGAPAYSAVRYNDLWPGIDLLYYDHGGSLEYRFVVHPGADPSAIQVAYRGAKLSVLGSGNLRAATPVKTLSEKTPVAYQGTSKVPAEFRVSGNAYSLSLGGYDPSRTLIVDPVSLSYAGYIGGAVFDWGHSIAVDSSGAAYVTGRTFSDQSTFPVSVGPDLTFNGGGDAFVAKVSPSGDSLAYAGYIGGAGDDQGYGIAVDSSGAAYITGTTTSDQSTFPVSTGPDVTYNGSGTYSYGDAFVAKVAPSGASLIYAGYIGGAGDDSGSGIAVDSFGAAYVTGQTGSDESTFPVSGGPDLTYNGVNCCPPFGDAFVAKVSPSGASLSYAGYIGGAGEDYGSGIAVDTSGAAYVTGYTLSDQSTFPVSGGPDLTYNGGQDGFVAKVAPSGASLTYSGYFGGTGQDSGRSIAVDPFGAAYVTGTTWGMGFPVSGGPDLTYNGSNDAFVAKVSPAGASLIYAGYIGGAGDDRGRGIAVDPAGAAYVMGITASDQTTFPVSGGPDLTYNGGSFDAFVAKVDPSGASLAYAGYIGGAGQDGGQGGAGIAVDSAGAAYLTGMTQSDQSSFPVLVGPDLTFNGGVDAFVAKVSPYQPDAQISVGSGSYVGDNIYNTTASGQSKSKKIPAGKSATFNVKVQNDGDSADSFTLYGCGSASGFKVAYMQGATNVTTGVVAGTYPTGSLAAGAEQVITLKIKAKSTLASGKKKVCLVTATSVGDGTKKDAVKATVTVK